MPQTRHLELYTFLAQVPGFKTRYAAKIMLVAFLGTHVPLLTLLISFLVTHSESFETMVRVSLIALIATLVGTCGTLYALNNLLVPVILTANVLKKYSDTQQLLKLPVGFQDEAGTLMGYTYQTLYKLDTLIDYITHYDELTGIPNGELLRLRLREIIVKASQPFALIMVGVNDFSDLCDRRETEVINQLLKAITQRLQSSIDSSDIVAYWGPGVFSIVGQNMSSFEEVLKQSQLILSNLNQNYDVEGQRIQISVSLGIYLSSSDVHLTSLDNPDEMVDRLIEQAKITLRTAQRDRSPYQFYSPSLSQKLRRQVVLENDLHDAVERGEMQVHYQPIVSLKSGEMIGVEALIRWRHPTIGWVSPAQFIPIAEANGLIESIGEWVLRTACTDGHIWHKAGFDSLRISVNLSARQLEQTNLLRNIRQILDDTKMLPKNLELEVTESSLMTNIERSVETLTELREQGISIALDDFGTGYSSLSYLKRLPVNMLKIDRSFVINVLNHTDDAAITNGIIALSRSLNLNITVEGIETKEQLNYFKNQDCHEGQGFYFSRAIPSKDVTELLQRMPFDIMM